MKQLIKCKRCASTNNISNGILRNKQSYKCKDCHYRFVIGDGRRKLSDKDIAIAILLYSCGGCSYRFIGRLLRVSPVAIMKLIKRTAAKVPFPIFDSSLKSVSFDEMHHFLKKKAKRCGFDGQWSVFEIELLGGLLEIVVVDHSENFSKDLSI